MGPHQSIMAFLTEGGQGAAAWTARRIDDRSYLALVAPSRRSRRWNMVGTHWLMVIFWLSINASARSASNRRMITEVAPMAWAPKVKLAGAPWYRGAGLR